MNVSFKEWESLYEGNFFDKVKNILSKSLGGAIDKIDGLLDAYRKSEMDYIKDWDNGSIEKDKLEIELSQSKSDPAEIKKIQRMIKRNKDVLETSQRSRKDRAEAIERKVSSITKNNERLNSYWEVELSRINAEVSEKLHKKAKSLNNDSEAKSLYDIYKRALVISKEKEDNFKSKFGSSFIGKSENKEYSEGEGGTDASKELYLNLPIKDFTSKIKSLDPKEKKALISRLIQERNDRYVTMDMEQDSLLKQLDSKKLKGKDLEEEKKKIKESKEKYLEEIRDLRSKITIARRNV
jgi:predicted phage tail protein